MLCHTGMYRMYPSKLALGRRRGAATAEARNGGNDDGTEWTRKMRTVVRKKLGLLY